MHAPPRRVKPRLRGVSHLLAFVVALPLGIHLISMAGEGVPTLAAAIYCGSLAALFGASALYHRPMWSPAARARLKRVDHAAIFVLIAGTYTPICLLAMGDGGGLLLTLAWVGAGLGILRVFFWPRAPRWLVTSIYVALGWMGLWTAQAVWHTTGSLGLTWMLAGGGLYTLGAVIYALRRPDPFPRTFGYHEVFHLLVIAAAALHFALVTEVVAPSSSPVSPVVATAAR